MKEATQENVKMKQYPYLHKGNEKEEKPTKMKSHIQSQRKKEK